MPKPPLPDYDEALSHLMAHVSPLGTQRVALGEACGRVLRKDVVADRDQPPFDRAAMDGFAVRSSELATDRTWPVCGSIAAGAAPSTADEPLKPGSVVRIATGARLPSGADAVVPVEQAISKASGGPEHVVFRISAIDPWQHVHRSASDAGIGTVVLSAGTRLGPHHVGIAATVGEVSLEVSARPRVALLTSGDEVMPSHLKTDQLAPQQIRNSNAPMLTAWLNALNVELVTHEHAPDDPQQTLALATGALARGDLVITTGGVSAGEYDWLPRAWEQLGLQTLLHGVSIQPGKPVLAARSQNGQLVLGLPGNPVSVLATAHLFAWPTLNRMQSAGGLLLPWRPVLLAEPVKPNRTRTLFRAVQLTQHGEAKVLPWHGSGDLMHTAKADGLVRLAKQEAPVPARATVPFLPLVS